LRCRCGHTPIRCSCIFSDSYWPVGCDAFIPHRLQPPHLHLHLQPPPLPPPPPPPPPPPSFTTPSASITFPPFCRYPPCSISAPIGLAASQVVSSRRKSRKKPHVSRACFLPKCIAFNGLYVSQF
jgi:hypothetical protein